MAHGIAAHWHYHEQGSVKIEKKFSWVKELANWKKELKENKKYLEQLKIDVFQNRIFVFTPRGDVIDLPEGSTPVDFAYHVHTDIGNQCVGARVNEQIVSLDTLLKSGDLCDIIIDKKRKGPNPDWLTFVKTQTANHHIKTSKRKLFSIPTIWRLVKNKKLARK